MQVLVFSDTHGAFHKMRFAVLRQKPDAVVHLGDYEADAAFLQKEFPDIPVVSVCGNCDRNPQQPEMRVLEWEGVRILMMHGHCFGVKNSLLRACYAAEEAEADILLYGHTHIPVCTAEGSLRILNPGACPDEGYASYGEIVLENGTAVCTLRTIG